MRAIGDSTLLHPLLIASATPDALSPGAVENSLTDRQLNTGDTTATAAAPRILLVGQDSLAAINSDPGRPQRNPPAMLQQQQGAPTSGLLSAPKQPGNVPSFGGNTLGITSLFQRKPGRQPSSPRPESAGTLSGPPIVKRRPGRQRKMAQPESTAPSAGVTPIQSVIPIKRGRGRPPKQSKAGTPSLAGRAGPSGQPLKKRGRPPLARPALEPQGEIKDAQLEFARSPVHPPVVAAAAVVLTNRTVTARRTGRPPLRFSDTDAGADLLGLGLKRAKAASQALNLKRAQAARPPPLPAASQQKRGQLSTTGADARAASGLRDKVAGKRPVGRPRLQPPTHDQPGSPRVPSGKQQALEPGPQSVDKEPAGPVPGKGKRKYKVLSDFVAAEVPVAVVTAKRSKVAGQLMARATAQNALLMAASAPAPKIDAACFASICKTIGSALESGGVGESVWKETLWQVTQHALGPSKLPADQVSPNKT